MEIDEKINESNYFLKRMKQTQKQPKIFQYYLSAFLSSSRSALQYLLEQVKTQKGGQKWYDEKMTQSQLLSYFKNKRDTNIHRETIKTSKDVQIVFLETLKVTESFSVVIRDALSNIVGKFSNKNAAENTSEEKVSKIFHIYRFLDWNGNEDIITLTNDYMKILLTTVKEAKKLGLIH
jgi:hypothetical protein